MFYIFYSILMYNFLLLFYIVGMIYFLIYLIPINVMKSRKKPLNINFFLKVLPTPK
jgi:hypothetical protein